MALQCKYRENIRYGRLDASEEEVIAGAKELHTHIISLKHSQVDMIWRSMKKAIISPRTETVINDRKSNLSRSKDFDP